MKLKKLSFSRILMICVILLFILLLIKFLIHIGFFDRDRLIFESVSVQGHKVQVYQTCHNDYSNLHAFLIVVDGQKLLNCTEGAESGDGRLFRGQIVCTQDTAEGYRLEFRKNDGLTYSIFDLSSDFQTIVYAYCMGFELLNEEVEIIDIIDFPTY